MKYKLSERASIAEVIGAFSITISLIHVGPRFRELVDDLNSLPTKAWAGVYQLKEDSPKQ